ncbi:hypothetical protein DM860_017625 [Cuscuta australis]|uniref:Reverse transcriptase zinc-binding domain-containing protein n=1 Tax=Cuscuta australis TaxID=267555 RepID=A0A328EBP6_9ASTE|nr:hypothetical protein DM860_017625 [Cuscuta australis]
MENGDDWYAMDKLYHVLFCFSIAVITSAFAGWARYPFIRRRRIWVGSIVSLAAGAAKEVADELGFFKSAGASSKDAVADVFGILIAALILRLGMDRDGDYTPAKGYIWLIGESSKPVWCDIVWNKWSIPKHQFIYWLICKGRLQAKQRLSKLLSLDTCCSFRGYNVEDVHHLFCICTFAMELLSIIPRWVGTDLNANSLQRKG